MEKTCAASHLRVSDATATSVSRETGHHFHKSHCALGAFIAGLIGSTVCLLAFSNPDFREGSGVN